MNFFCLRIIFAYIFLYSTLSFTQSKHYKYKVDSIRKLLFNSKEKDSSLTAKSHYSLGELYRYNYMGDSAYYHYYEAEKLFRALDNKIKTARVLYGISVIQKNDKDLTGSELTSTQALSILESLEETKEVLRYKSFCYNNLGVLFGDLQQYDESIRYHKKALEIKQRIKGDNVKTIDISKNNLALAYKRSGDYELALEYYSQILSDDNLVKKRPGFYLIVMDNYAHTLYLLKSNKPVLNLYFKALKVSDTFNLNSYASIQINQHIAEYYNDKKLKDSARYYAYKAKEISKQYYNDELLKSLLLLSKIEEGDVAAQHLREYVKLSDSLLKQERAKRDKFARIRFETEQIEEENVRIGKERVWLIIITIILLFSIVLIYIIVTQRAKNKELEFNKQQQEANEEIYNLMLTQQDTIEEVRTLEKQRISKELHDGILGRLFGTRLSLDSLNMNNSTEAIKTRGDYIVQLKTIEEDIRKVSHELNTDFISGSGFIDIVKTLLETQMNIYKLTYTFKYDDAIHWDTVSNKYKIHIYRIIQESIHNIYKHAQANHVNVSFKWKNNVICLAIQDDGKGFDVTKARKGIGLKNMTSRINEIQGELHLASKINEGTTVIINVPINYD